MDNDAFPNFVWLASEIRDKNSIFCWGWNQMNLTFDFKAETAVLNKLIDGKQIFYDHSRLEPFAEDEK